MEKRKSEIAQIADRVRAQLKAELPDCKFSVRTEIFSGGRELKISLMEAPFQIFDDRKINYAQLNTYQFGEGKTYEEASRRNNGETLTPKGWEVMNKANTIGQAENWDKGDIMSDYSNVNYYFHIEVGQWNKPLKIVEKKAEPKPQAPMAREKFNTIEYMKNLRTSEAQEEEEIKPTLNPISVIPTDLKSGDRLGFKIIAVIGGAGDWAAYRGLTSQSDDEIARQGDKIDRDAAEFLFYAPKALGLKYRGY